MFADLGRSQKMIVSRESSPYTENSSPPSFMKGSPRDFWFSKETMSPSRFNDSENTPERPESPALNSPKRRPSVERLMQASRVRNSNIFALENKDAYDPSNVPVVERPRANRPLSQSLANNNFARFDSIRKENNPFRSPERKQGHKRSESQIDLPMLSPTKEAAGVPLPASPEKHSSPSSPTKSSLARTSQFGVFDPEMGTWSDDEGRVPTPRAFRGHAKSVTFHEEPPVVNEYEQQTPEPSVSVASDREGSWDSDDFYDEDISFDRGSSAEPAECDDSFDADLENAEKTPVVLPEHWSRMSPDEARMDLVDRQDDVFDEEHGEDTVQGLPTGTNSRVASDGSESSRPLPPLPAFMQQERRNSGSLSDAAERAAHGATRSLLSPPKRASCSKDDILKMTAQSSLSLQDRLALMNDRPSSKDSAVSHGHVETQQEELTITNLDTGERVEFNVTEREVESADDSMVNMSEFSAAPPRISRESILRNVRNSKYAWEDDSEDDINESTMASIGNHRPPIAELARMDPDQAIPSREHSIETGESYDNYEDAQLAATYLEDQRLDDEVKIKDEPVDDTFDMSAIPASGALTAEEYANEYDRQGPVLRHEYRDNGFGDDTSSRYSSAEPDAESTMLHTRQEDTELTQQYEDPTDGKETLQDAMQLLSVKDYGETKGPMKQGSGEFVGLPAYLSTDDFHFGMKEYITPSPPNSSSSQTTQKKPDVMKDLPALQPPATASAAPTTAAYEEHDVSPPDTPTSVVHHSGEVSPIEEKQDEFKQQPAPEPAREVPARLASIKTPGGKLKARRSGTAQDFETMAEQRRMVSADMRDMPVPAIPQQYQNQHGDDTVDGAAVEQESADGSRPTSSESQTKENHYPGKKAERRKSRKSGGRMDLMLDTSSFSIGEDLDDSGGLGLDQEFDRVIEGQKVCYPAFPPPMFARFDATASSAQPLRAQQSQVYVSPYRPHSAGTDVYSSRIQKGYLMRQNTKVVVATNRNVSGESNGTAKSSDSRDSAVPMSPKAETRPASSPKKASSSPRKGSAEQFLKTEPWNGKMRRKSIRNASAQKTAYKSEPAPPLPGQESALGVVDEAYAAGSANLEDDVGEGVERGRLFVKVVGVKDLDLPMPRNDRIYFQLTLDNGLHCVTTTSLELGKSAPIGQEFELVVLNDLEFQLTLTTRLPPPPTTPTAAPASPSKSHKSKGSASGFSRFLTSPKKRAEKERQEREAAEAEERRLQEEAKRKRASQLPSAWDLLHDLVNASDGSFARAYVNLKAHERSCFGRQLTVDVPCYNEWALEQDQHVVNSVRSKRGANAGPVRRPPYVVGALELQLLYVPKPKNAGDEDMPKSMSGAAKEMKKAREIRECVHEGHLSQQGGDCTVSCLSV